LNTRSSSTIEPLAKPRSTPSVKFETDPFRTARPRTGVVLPEIANIPAPGVPGPLPLIEKPARLMLTDATVITKQLPAAEGMSRLFASTYEPGALIVWHAVIAVGAACAAGPAPRIIAPRASVIGKRAARFPCYPPLVLKPSACAKVGAGTAFDHGQENS